MKNILVTGAYGQLGQELQEISKKYNFFQFTFVDIDDLNITNYGQLKDFFSANTIDYIINCAAYTAVDMAETEAEIAEQVNSKAVSFLAEFANNYKSKIIHISSDYVFDGTAYRPYKEDDQVNPNSVYGQTKLNGEKEVLKTKHGIVIRTSWLYSSYGNNFCKTMMKLGIDKPEIKVVYDQLGTPTFGGDLAEAIMLIIEKDSKNPATYIPGIYHFSNEGVCSWYDYAIEIMNISDIECKIIPIESKDFPQKANRPHYSILNKSKIKSTYNVNIPHWKDSLKKCIYQIKINHL